MARSTSRPGRTLAALVALLAVLFGTVAAGVVWSDAQWTPKLALDLEGGTQIILTPVALEGGGEVKPTTEQLAQAVSIIRQRIDGSGVSESEVTTEGGKNIVVSLSGNADEKTRNLVKQSAQLRFRSVLYAAATTPAVDPSATATPSGTATPGSTATPSATPSATPTSESTAGAATPSSNNMNIPRALVEKAAATTPTTTPTPSAAATGAIPTAGSTAAPSASATSTTPQNASDLKWVTPELAAQFQALDCSNLANREGGGGDDPAKPLVACKQDGTEKYILGPAEIDGTDISDAIASMATTSQGAPTGGWEVRITFTGQGGSKFAAVTERLATFPNTEAQNRFGIVLDGLVVTAPTTNERIPNGQAQITGDFTQAEAQTLANQLKFGALPLSFRVDTEDQISALLGGQQLERGLLAGAIGLALVVAYSLLQYRALGFVTVASLLVSGIITYGMVLLLGWREGFRLSLPGVTGLIVSVGITADSFIVYFERIRDEVRDGRGLRSAVEVAWQRARRTILISDAVSLLAAVVLYILAVGGVRGFAFTLGLTTVIDIIVVILFTKPLVTLLSRTRFFGSGHRWSGFDATHLGREITYAGRGRVRTKVPAAGGQTIAERRAAAAEQARDDDDPGLRPEVASDGRPVTREGNDR